MLELNKIYLGDCLEVMNKIDDKSIDMILCDLPYGITSCNWDLVVPLNPLWDHYNRIIKDNGTIVLTATQPFTSFLVISNLKMFKYTWIWGKNRITGFANAKKQHLRNCEDIVVFSKTVAQYYPQGLNRIDIVRKNGKSVGGQILSGGKIGNGHGSLRSHRKEYVQEFTNYPRQLLLGIKEDFPKIHPTQKPVSLFEYLIKTHSQKGGIVLDNCAGSGTTGVACQNTERSYILIEKDEKYYEAAKKRLEVNSRENSPH
jgi:site-specific DNA-methyltransferase (adenine-specific)